MLGGIKKKYKENARMHGEFPRSLDEKFVDTEQPKGETESTIVTAQGQKLSIDYFKKNLKEEIESKCTIYVKK
jgi:hypothetical protein